MGEDFLEGTAGATIARFKNGAEKQLMLATETLEAAMEAVREGRFDDAEERLQDGAGFVSALAQAERAFARLDGQTDIILARDLAEGQLLWGYGIVLAVDTLESPSRRRTLMKVECRPIHGEDREITIDPEKRVLIEIPEEKVEEPS